MPYKARNVVPIKTRHLSRHCWRSLVQADLQRRT